MTVVDQGSIEDPIAIPVKGIRGDIRSCHVATLRPTDRNTPLSEMKRRLQEDGYLFVKGLIPREDVLNVRKHYFMQFEGLGMLKPGTSPEQGIFDDAQDPAHHAGIGSGSIGLSEDEQKKLVEAHYETEYLRFLEHEALRQMVRSLMGWQKDVLLRRTMLRHNIPNGLSTGVHYDKLFLRGGDAYFLTAWVPIGDISHIGGGLIYLSDSKELGRSIEHDFSVRAQIFPEAERISAFNAHMGQFGQLSDNAGEFHRETAGSKGKWLVSAYEAGDVVFHDPYMIHGSSRNEDPEGRIRLSTDLRFYEEGSDMDLRWHQGYWYPGDGL